MVFLLHYKAELIETFLNSLESDQQLRNCQIRTITEPKPLGTGGAVAHAVQAHGIDGSFLVANADAWLGAGIQEVSRAANPAMAVIHVQDSGRYGIVQIQNHHVVSFQEKQADAASGWINAGLYNLNSDLFRGWRGGPLSLERDIFPVLAKEGKLHAVPLKTEFIDIGIPADYFRFCRWIDSGKIGVP